MPSPFPASRNSADTKLRIINVAQDVFSTKGYSHVGLREIARIAEVAPSLVIKYFGTKPGLFEEALRAAILPLDAFQRDRARIGEAIAAAVLDPGSKMAAPTMIALGSGDPEVREVVARVIVEHILLPMADWLDHQDSLAIALNILAMTTGFAVLHRSLRLELGRDEIGASATQFAEAVQFLVDAS